MLTLSECHFWTSSAEVQIAAKDLGAFRYSRNRELNRQQHEKTLIQAKCDYTVRRNGTVLLKNSRKHCGRLKDNLKKLEELQRVQKIVFTQWQGASQVLLLFADGLIAHICIDIYSGEILRILFEKKLVGKLASDTITDAFFTRSHIILAFNYNQLTVVYLQQPNARPQGPEKISNMDPRIFHVIIPGPSERKLARHLSVNSSYDLFVIWTNSSQNEVFPWRPTIRDQDRANIHVFKLKTTQLELNSYCWTENDPLYVDFLRSSESQILTVEQKVSRKGEISAEICSYEISTGKMQRTAIKSIALGTQICCFAFSPDQEKLFLGTIDRNVCLHDLVLQTTKFVSDIEIIPTQCSWHSDSSLIMIANERAQFQCFDLALTPIGNQLQDENVTPSKLLDLSHYFAQQPSLLNISFSRKPELANFTQVFAQTDCFLFFSFKNGPIGCLRLFAGAGMRGDIHNSGMTADVLIDQYLEHHQLENAVNLLLALNWETYGAMCLISLHKIANYVFFREDTQQKRIELMAKALQSFSDALSEETKDEFSDQVFDLKRRFFFYLLRKKLWEDAFEIAEDIEDYDLFMDLFNFTKVDPSLNEFTTAAFSQAAVILHEEERANGNLSLVGDYRSESVCSQSTIETSDIISKTKSQHTNLLQNYVPPLPSVKMNAFNADMIKINISKPEVIARTDISRQGSPSPPPLPNVRFVKVKAATEVEAISYNLAKLSLKSSFYQRQKTKNTYGKTMATSALHWKQMQDQTIGVPTISNLNPNTLTNSHMTATVQNMLPHTLTITATNDLYGNNNHTRQSSPYLPYVTPIPIDEHKAISTTQRITVGSPSYQPKFYQHPLVSGTIPPTAAQRLLKKPTTSILSNSSAAMQNGLIQPPLAAVNVALNGNGNKETGAVGKNTVGERNKVKFSDTVQVAMVPEISRKEKPSPPKRNGYTRPQTRHFTNPRKELADSLPLCHPNEDYLKDFNPIRAEEPLRPSQKSNTKDEDSSKNKNNSASVPSVKVVHFGVV